MKNKKISLSFSEDTSDTILFFTSSCLEKTLENVSIDVKPSFDIVIFYYKKIK